MRRIGPFLCASLGLLACSSPGTQEKVDETTARKAAACAAVGKTVSTEGDSTCTEQQPLDKYAFLRRLSLDLRNTLPSVDEYSTLDAQEDVPESTIDAWLETDDFRLAMRRLHEHWLWPNPQGVDLLDLNVRLGSSQISSSTTAYSVLSTARRNLYRGTSSVVCGDWRQTEFDGSGAPIPRQVSDPSNPSKTINQEGWVEVNPYWDPSSTIKVCAFDAQTAAQGSSQSCDVVEGIQDSRCGCGPNLQWCFGPPVQNALWIDLREQLGRSVDRVTQGDAPYTELLTGTTIDFNGRLAFWRKHLANMTTLQRTYNHQGPGDPTLPDTVDYLDPNWTTYSRSDKHSGILTLPAYTLRFQTNRARANRFRIVFTGQYFIPPSTQEDPEVDGCQASSGDLTQQCTCRSCHQVLEPLAAYFGPVAEAGSRLMTDFPSYTTQCDPTRTSSVLRSCSRFYAVDSTAQNPGWLLTHQYAYLTDAGHNNTGLDDALHRQIAEHLTAGPAALAQSVIDDGQLANAMVMNLFRELMGRDMNLDPSSETSELELLDTLAADFRTDYSFKRLVRQLVLLPQYRRIR